MWLSHASFHSISTRLTLFIIKIFFFHSPTVFRYVFLFCFVSGFLMIVAFTFYFLWFWLGFKTSIAFNLNSNASYKLIRGHVLQEFGLICETKFKSTSDWHKNLKVGFTFLSQSKEVTKKTRRGRKEQSLRLRFLVAFKWVQLSSDWRQCVFFKFVVSVTSRLKWFRIRSFEFW